MKKIFAALALSSMVAVPVTAVAQQTMSEQELIAYAVERNVCGTGTVSSASYDPADTGKILVTCTMGGSLEGEFAVNGGAVAAGVAVVALAIAASGGGSTSDTQ